MERLGSKGTYGEYLAPIEYMATSVRLEPELESRLNRLARDTNRTKAFYLRELVVMGLEDIEDAYLGAAALEEHRRTGERTIPLDQLVKDLGLEG
ncbi:RHH-type rel operon transcriptional repressor/antitoxin RelB [Synechococcus sp. Ace-Pa]|uniref:type II toxin-antitoxin system RelB family antitoxin n=1 Tax=Synechococcaceae TaxID=1890426 RepID=UPI0011AD2600|nr:MULTISPECIES: DNA-binding protein [Synechococcaceae]MCT4364788.1 DNA-binding protein [Candidatus Regnicoccus frigidus MAG-AL1]MCT4366446.1 DNA-binding protein [Candidatus Regnicoccus frigidus MAG-AL2]TWB87694.1 RHH-type rel operon transcriptional repressor/antitoxin RelB [Synechococcus sp. Ace-Pa]